MVGYVYKTTNNINGYVYIGQHKRGKFNRKYRGSGKLFKEALKEFGWGNFTTEILYKADTYEELNEMERVFIQAHRDQPNYNIARGGTGGVASSKYIFVDLETKLIYTSIGLAAMSANVSQPVFKEWVNYNGKSNGMIKYLSKNKSSAYRTIPKNIWITHRWVKLESSALLRIKNPIFAKGL
jgi:hypothetical protein